MFLDFEEKNKGVSWILRIYVKVIVLRTDSDSSFSKCHEMLRVFVRIYAIVFVLAFSNFVSRVRSAENEDENEK